MNKFKLMAFALVFGTASLFANNIDPKISNDEIRNQIIELISDIQSDIISETVVDITFTFNSEGEIVILKVNSNEKQVRAFIRENINGKKLDNPGQRNVQYTIPIVIE